MSDPTGRIITQKYRGDEISAALLADNVSLAAIASGIFGLAKQIPHNSLDPHPNARYVINFDNYADTDALAADLLALGFYTTILNASIDSGLLCNGRKTLLLTDETSAAGRFTAELYGTYNEDTGYNASFDSNIRKWWSRKLVFIPDTNVANFGNYQGDFAYPPSFNWGMNARYYPHEGSSSGEGPPEWYDNGSTGAVFPATHASLRGSWKSWIQSVDAKVGEVSAFEFLHDAVSIFKSVSNEPETIGNGISYWGINAAIDINDNPPVNTMSVGLIELVPELVYGVPPYTF